MGGIERPQAKTAVMADLLDISVQALGRFEKQGKLQGKVGHGLWDVKETFQSFVRYRTKEAENSDGVKSEELRLTMARRRKTEADADAAEMNRDIQRGELVEVDVAVGLVADRIQTLRSRILNLPTKLAVKMAATRTREEAVELLEAELTQLLEELSGGAGGRN